MLYAYNSSVSSDGKREKYVVKFLFPQLKILFPSEEINQHIINLINQMRWSFSLSVLLL